MVWPPIQMSDMEPGNLPNSSEAAVDSEVKIIAAENLILSYETLKYYELEQPVRTIDGA
jgi:hypothetical protein